MSEVYFVRHGQASFGSDNYDQLSPKGHQQARMLGEYFATQQLQFDHILTGDMVRHRETAEGICAGMGIEASDRDPWPGIAAGAERVVGETRGVPDPLRGDQAGDRGRRHPLCRGE